MSTSGRSGEEDAPRRVLLTSHCILNQNAVVEPLARSAGAMTDAVAWALAQGWGIFQLPCPEFRFAGPRRAPASFDDYNTDAFHESNRALLQPVIARLKRYRDAGYEIVGGLHVQGSPACDPDTGNWITDVLAAAADAGIEIRQFWQIPDTPTGAFSADDPAVDYGPPGIRSTYPPNARTVSGHERREALHRRSVQLGATLAVRDATP